MDKVDAGSCLSKNELLDWLRLSSNYPVSKVEECGNGVVYLLIMEAIYPGKVPLRKIKYNAKQEWECLHNLKLLQTVFMEQRIKKNLDIDRLAKCIFTDNLEFVQWLKRHYDRFAPPTSHGGQTLRQGSASQAEMIPSNLGGGGSTGTASTSTHSIPSTQSRQPGTVYGAQSTRSDTSSFHGPYTRQRPLPTGSALAHTASQIRSTRKDAPPLEDEVEKLREILKQRDEEIKVLRQELEDTEAESHFYFGKLRAFEMLAVDPDRKGFTIPEVETILFSEENFTEEQLVEAVLNCSKKQGSNVLNEFNSSEKALMVQENRE